LDLRLRGVDFLEELGFGASSDSELVVILFEGNRKMAVHNKKAVICEFLPCELSKTDFLQEKRKLSKSMNAV
jgi:hypothetical protein